MDKATLVQSMVDAGTAIAQAHEALQAAYSIYFDNEYNLGDPQSPNANRITDADLTGAGFPFTAAQLGNLITFAEQLNNLMEGQETVAKDYSATLNVIRSVV
jgi:hypothetical protein